MTTKNYGLTSMHEDMAEIGLMPAPPRGGSTQGRAPQVPETVRLMEGRIAQRFGGAPRSTSLAKMRQLAEGAAQGGGQRQGGQRQGAPRRDPARVKARVYESLRAYVQRSRTPGPVAANLRVAAGGSARTVALAEEVSSLLAELRTVNQAEAVKSWANVAVISEMLARRIHHIGRKLGEAKIAAVGTEMGRLANKATAVVEGLRKSGSVRGLAEKFNQAMTYVVAGTQLYAGLTEGPDAPFPITPGAKPGQVPGQAPGQPPMPGMEADPMADPMGGGMGPGMGAPTPTQGVEGMGGMGGGMGAGFEGGDPMGGDPSDPLGMGAPGGAPGQPPMPPQGEAMDDDDRVPFFQGGDNPDLDTDLGLGEGDDPLGMADGQGDGNPFGQGR